MTCSNKKRPLRILINVEFSVDRSKRLTTGAYIGQDMIFVGTWVSCLRFQKLYLYDHEVHIQTFLCLMSCNYTEVTCHKA